MSIQHTTRLALPYPATTRVDSADVPRDVAALANALDGAVIFGQGTYAARPVSTTGTPGKQGRFYYVRDPGGPHDGELSYDYGTGWRENIGSTTIPDRSIAGIKLVLDTVTAAEIAAGAVGTAELADLAVTAAKVANALKPSAGASGATEALRALGTQPGQAAASIHGAQHAADGPDPIPVKSLFAAIRARASAVGQTFPSTVDVPLNLNTYDFETFAGQMHSGANPSRLIAPVAGVYRVHSTGSLDNNAQVTFKIVANGATTLATIETTWELEATWQLAQGDYVELVVRNHSGTTRNLVVSAPAAPVVEMHRIG